jgi:predicted transcriptional regulator
MSSINSDKQTHSRFAEFFEQSRGDVRKQRKVITECLAEEPKTISDISQSTGLNKKLILWNLMGMLKWGEVLIVDETEDELVYALKES